MIFVKSVAERTLDYRTWPEMTKEQWASILAFRPRGYGKLMTLLSSWAAYGISHGWLTLEEVKKILNWREWKMARKAEPMSSGKIRRLQNFKTALGMMSNWVDMDTGIMYHIQEYAEALHDPKIPKDQKPTKIRMTKYKTGEEIGWIDENLVADKMKDPDPDPRY